MVAKVHMSHKRIWLARIALLCVCGGVCLVGQPAMAKHLPDDSLDARVPGITSLVSSEKFGDNPYVAKRKNGRGRSLDNLSQEERKQLRRKYDEWQSLPPEEKRNLRNRMRQWNQMSPQQRQQYQRRHHQWQQLSPQERKQLRRKLDQWDRLSPEERETIRRQFKN